MNDLLLITLPLACILGLLFGSFFNVCIYRMPNKESIIWPGSHCPACGHPISMLENIPVLSFIFLRGACAECRKPISLQYPVIELVTAFAMGILWYRVITPFTAAHTAWWDYLSLVLQVWTLLVLIPVTVIDYRHYIIPDAFTLPGLIAGCAISLVPGTITPLESLLGIAAGGGSLLALGYFGEFVMRRKDAMGGGDIKLMAFVGAVFGWKIACEAIIIGALLGSVAGVALMALHVLRKDHRIPFGPFLAAGVWIALIFGETLVTKYFLYIEHMADMQG
jgi:leader peptidase (prepilin peptidase)/N-methyltransferase